MSHNQYLWINSERNVTLSFIHLLFITIRLDLLYIEYKNICKNLKKKFNI